jgi:5'-3' exonuclease
MGIDVIVAPYEADAQLAYLNRAKIADYVITEDSDLVLFGCHHVRNENEKRRKKSFDYFRFYLNLMNKEMVNYLNEQNLI